MSPSAMNTNEAAKLMLNHMWLKGAYHLTTLKQEFTAEGVPAEIVAKCGLAQLKMEQRGIIARVGPDIYDFIGRVVRADAIEGEDA